MDYVHFGIGDKLIFLLLLWAITFPVFSSARAHSILIAASTCLFICHLRQKRVYWRVNNVPSVEAHLMFGSSFDLFREGVGSFFAQRLHSRGSTFGMVYVDRNEICTVNLRLLREVLVKQFDHFRNRLPVMVRGRLGRSVKLVDNSIFKNTLSTQKDEKWNRVRSAILPAFNSRSLRKLTGRMNECAMVMLDEIGRHADEVIELKPLLRLMAMDMIGRVGFSLDLHVYGQPSENSPALKEGEVDINSQFLEMLIKGSEHQLPRYKTFLLVFCPFLMSVVERLTGYDTVTIGPNVFFRRFLLDLLEIRRTDMGANSVSSKDGGSDLFQLLIEATKEHPLLDSCADLSSWSEYTQSTSPLTKMELLGVTFVLFGAGYQINAYALQYALYHLACLPEVQERVRLEVNRVVGDEPTVSFEDAASLSYTRQVVMETLRICPNSPMTNRECNADTLLDGIPLKEGDVIDIPIYSIHHHDDYYPKPEQFDPDRFSEEATRIRNPITFVTFGYGRRKCVADRLVILSLIIFLAQSVRRYRFTRAVDSPDLPIRTFALDFTKPIDDLKVLAERVMKEQ